MALRTTLQKLIYLQIVKMVSCHRLPSLALPALKFFVQAISIKDREMRLFKNAPHLSFVDRMKLKTFCSLVTVFILSFLHFSYD